MADFTKNSIGSKIVLLVRNQGSGWSEVQNATTKQIKIKPISTGVESTYTASFAQAPDGVGDGSDGKLEYTTTATTDLPESGKYEVRGYLVIPGVYTGHTVKSYLSVQ